MNASQPLLFKIGEVASRSGLPVKTIRYYDEIGLLSPTVERSTVGYRLFHATVLERLGFIKRAQSFGLSLQDIKLILTVHDEGQLPCQQVKRQIETKVQTLTEQIAQLETLRSQLGELLDRWQENPPAEFVETMICPNLERVEHDRVVDREFGAAADRFKGARGNTGLSVPGEARVAAQIHPQP